MSEDRPVVTDTGPLIHLSEAGALSLLSQFSTVLVPETVFRELRRGGVPDAYDSLDHERRRVDVAADRWPELDPGETVALALTDRVDGLLLTDDMATRQQAEDIGIEGHGSIGVVLVAYADNRLSAKDAKTRIRALEHDSTLYLSKPLVERAIRRIEREESNDSDE